MAGSKAKSPSTHVTDSIDIDMSDDDDNDELDSGDDSHLIAQQLKGKKRAQDDETLEDTNPAFTDTSTRLQSPNCHYQICPVVI